jgi:hypothetical protein
LSRRQWCKGRGSMVATDAIAEESFEKPAC